MTNENRTLVKKLISNKDNLQKLPPIYAFQSIVDATVNPNKLIDLMDEIGTKESELRWPGNFFSLSHICISIASEDKHYGQDDEELLRDMVRNNILYFDPIEAIYYPQGKNYQWGIRLYFESLR